MSLPDSSPEARTIGYIGLGNAGYPLASTISRAGYRLVVADTNAEQAKKFSLEHAHAITASNEDLSLFKDVDILVTMLPNGDIVRDVLVGEQGIAKNLKNGAVIIDTSSSSPFDTQETGRQLQALNSTLTLIDSPVTQEYAFALAKGEATLMVGCSNSAALDIAMPVLRTIGKHVFVMGDLGAGHAMKTLNNYTSAASILGLCDALIAGQKFGLDPAQMVSKEHCTMSVSSLPLCNVRGLMNLVLADLKTDIRAAGTTFEVDVMNVGTGVNFSTKESFRTDALTRRFASGYQLSLLLKDMKIARSVIESVGMRSSLSDLIVDSLSEADSVAGPGADHTQCIEGWEKKFGVQLKQSQLSDH